MVTSNLGVFRSGLTVSLELTACVFVLSSLLGVLLAVCRISPVAPLRVAAGFYVTAFRSVPLLVLLTLFVFGLPDLGLVYSLFWTAVDRKSVV